MYSGRSTYSHDWTLNTLDDAEVVLEYREVIDQLLEDRIASRVTVRGKRRIPKGLNLCRLSAVQR